MSVTDLITASGGLESEQQTLRVAVVGAGFMGQVHAEAARREGGQTLLRDPGTLHPSAARYVRLPAGHAQGYQDCFDAFVADTYRAVRGEDVPGYPGPWK
jgi:predicted dehydrogenase